MGADITAYDKDGQLAAVIEVKNRMGTSRDWATETRQILYSNGLVPKARFFLFAMPDRIYCWKNNASASEAVEPDYEIDARPILEPYFRRSGLKPESLMGNTFSFLVASWLSELILADRLGTHPQPDWLTESGLVDAIRDGRLAYESQS